MFFVALVTASGIFAIAMKTADYGEAREVTRQVQIMADRDVSIAQINASRDVDIATIAADVTKQTSFIYWFGYFGRMAGVAVAILVVIMIWADRREG